MDCFECDPVLKVIMAVGVCILLALMVVGLWLAIFGSGGSAP